MDVTFDRVRYMKKHRIRLAGPWESQFIGTDGQPDDEVIRCELPFTLPESQRESGVLLTRRFHRPTGIDDTTILRIVLQSSERPAAVRLNGTDIAECRARPDAEFAFEITGQMAEFNLLGVLLRPAESAAPTTLNTAWLEIQE